MDVSEDELQELYMWVDEIPLSRPKRNIARDFADGVLMAEILRHYFPRLVELHNYSGAHAHAQKMYNWSTLNQKVLRRLGFLLEKREYEAVANCQPGAVERVLKLVRSRIAQAGAGLPSPTAGPPADTMARGTSEREDNEVSLAPPWAQPPGTDAPPQHEANGDATQSHAVLASYAFPPHLTAAVGGAVPNAKRSGGKVKEALVDAQHQLAEMHEANEILHAKIDKLEQLVRLKDAKIELLVGKLQAAGLT